MPDETLSLLEYHVLLAMVGQTRYGYDIRTAVEEESGGALAPRAGSLYRVLARLMTRGLVVEAEPQAGAPPHPGRERRYYALTPSGRTALAAEARRLREVGSLAEERLRATGEVS